MKAVVCTKYGKADVLKLENIAKPAPKDKQVLIKIMATTVTAGDCEIRSLRFNLFIKLILKVLILFKKLILGMELAGEIVEVGKKVTLFKVGDKVIAAPGFNTYAQYMCMDETGPIAIKPEKLSYEEAATISVGGITALYLMRKAVISPKDKVLIYGASGSIGAVAIQLAKYYGATVTAVCSTSNFELVKSLGADEVIDYTKEDYTKKGVVYDLIFDVLGKSTFSKNVNILSDKGYYLLGSPKFTESLKGFWVSMTTAKTVISTFALHDAEKLQFLADIHEQGIIKAVIDRTYSLEDIIDAHVYVEKGHKKGNVVITVCH
ncbi:MAG: NAD(P)-dependent alcohol dehydrogenase [Colwellia sp.]|nr:NAD(P)-dependent alcohol dehydrogenase [Colwellia sp.]